MRVLFVTRRYWPAVGGMEGLLRSVVHSLADRHEVRVLTQRVDDGSWDSLHDSVKAAPRFDAFSDGHVRVEQLSFPPGLRLALAPMAVAAVPGVRRHEYARHRVWLARYLATVAGPWLRRQMASADVVHMWGTDLLAYATVAAAKKVGAVAAISPFAHRAQWGTDTASAAAYKAADVVLALLEAEAELYCTDLGVARSSIRVCGACSDGAFAAGGPDVRAIHGIDGPLILFLGARREYKGVNVLLDTIPHVAQDRADVTFAFVGPGPPLPKVAADARVLDVGEVDDAERASWLHASDLMCLPSAGEILPISILEAWSTGTPVLTSDLTTLQELVDGSGGGMTAPRDPAKLAGAILSLVGETERLRDMGRRGHARWVAAYTVPAVAACIEDAYRSVGRQGQKGMTWPSTR
ncbi:MAG: glycosyltransferase family 4 protein [Acidimicrobiales bacterium]